MTEYEIRDLMTGVLGNATPVTTLYISVISGYLIIAWLVGRQLTRPQVILINIFFTLFSTMLAFRWGVSMRTVIAYREMVLEINPEAVFMSQITSGGVLALQCVYLAIVFASLKFMWDVRHPKTE